MTRNLPRCSCSIVTETHNFEILPFFLHGYHSTKLKNTAAVTAIPAIGFSPHNPKILPTNHM